MPMRPASAGSGWTVWVSPGTSSHLGGRAEQPLAVRAQGDHVEDERVRPGFRVLSRQPVFVEDDDDLDRIAGGRRDAEADDLGREVVIAVDEGLALGRPRDLQVPVQLTGGAAEDAGEVGVEVVTAQSEDLVDAGARDREGGSEIAGGR